MTAVKSETGKKRRRFTWGRALIFAAAAVVLALILALAAPAALNRFGPYAWHAYGRKFWWLLAGAGFVLWVTAAIWAVSRRKFVTKKSWAEQFPERFQQPEHGTVGIHTLTMWLVLPPVFAFGVSVIPIAQEHHLRQGIVQYAGNDFQQFRINEYTRYEEAPSSYPWEARSALWVDDYACVAQGSTYGAAEAALSALATLGESGESGFRDVHRSFIEEDGEMLPDARFLSLLDNIPDLAGAVDISGAGIEKLVLEIADICEARELDSADLGRLTASAKDLFNGLTRQVLNG